MLGFDGEYPAVHPKAKFLHFLVKNCKESAVKHCIEKPILLNFLNLSPMSKIVTALGNLEHEKSVNFYKR